VAVAVEGLSTSRGIDMQTERERTRWRRSRLLAAALASCAAAVVVFSASCAGQRGPGGPIRIAIGGQTNMVYLPTTLAEELGFYKEEGLEVELQDFDGGAKALQALIGGSAEVVSGYYDHTIQMAAEQRALVAFVTMLRYPGLVLVSSPQSAAKVRDIRALEGRIAGVTTPGSSSHMFMTFLLARHQVPVDSVSITAIGSGAAAVAGVESGRIDAAWLADPAFTLVKKRNPGIRVLADLRTEEGTTEAFGVATYPSAVLYSSADWLRTNRDTAARLARAIVKTLDWMKSRSEQEIAEKTPTALRGPDSALYVEALKGSRAMFSGDGLMTTDGAAAVLQTLQGSMPKVRDAVIDLSKTYTNDLILAR
jgi:NitT/TauT family transport system substrate-binding protein